MTLVEVMIAVLIFTVVMLGGMNYFALPKSAIVRQKVKRLAISAAHDHLDSLASLDYDRITRALNERGRKISLGKLAATRTTIITLVDDRADGLGANDADGDRVDYKIFTVRIRWGRSRSLALSSAKSKY